MGQLPGFSGSSIWLIIAKTKISVILFCKSPIVFPGPKGSLPVSQIFGTPLLMLRSLCFIFQINNDPTFFPIQLGLQVRGTCNLEPIALDQSLNFVLDKVPGVCTSNTSERNNNSGKLLGVVGASLSHVTAAVANLLRLFKIPQVTQLLCTAFL